MTKRRGSADIISSTAALLEMSTPRPLTRFSSYLSGRNDVLLAISAEIIAHLDACGPDEGAARSRSRARASDLMWLWTLGAYEVSRTMCQARACFSARSHRALSDLRLALERVRVPNTKMERLKYDRKSPGVPVRSDRAPEVWADEHRDILIGDPADLVSARRLLAMYAQVLAALTAEDILMKHEDSYERG